MAKRKNRIRPIVKLPQEYLEAVKFGNLLFPALFQLENGLRLALNNFLTTCYGPEWWDRSLKLRLADIHQYAASQEAKRQCMPWIGASKRVEILPIHLVTLGQLEEIVKSYRSDCIPDLFPNLEFFLGHMDVIKRVRNLYTHMFPCITNTDCQTAKREILTLSLHINARL